MIVAIIGSRTIPIRDMGYVSNEIFRGPFPIREYPIDHIVSGGANGADRIAELISIDKNIQISIYPPDWEKYGKKARPMRNQIITNESDICVGFLDKPLHESKGSYSCVRLFAGVKKRVFRIDVINPSMNGWC